MPHDLDHTRRYIPYAGLEELVGLGLVVARPDPTPGSPLVLFDYTHAAQRDRDAWTAYPLLSLCRGLIVAPATDEAQRAAGMYEAHARPFRKFWNLGEFPHLTPEALVALSPAQAPLIEISTKRDGSMVSLFHDSLSDSSPRWRFATRGSFTSDQALAAHRIWEERDYPQTVEPGLVPESTYIFELTAPWNRIVVGYAEEELTLIGRVDNHSGYESSYAQLRLHGMLLGLPVVDAFTVETLAEWVNLTAESVPNEEGFVVNLPGYGVRVKIKYPEYIRLHRLVSAPSVHQVWEHMVNLTMADFLAQLPPDLQTWFRNIAEAMMAEYDALYASLETEVTLLAKVHGLVLPLDKTDRDSRKRLASLIAPLPHSIRAALFLRADNRSVWSLLWKFLEP